MDKACLLSHLGHDCGNRCALHNVGINVDSIGRNRSAVLEFEVDDVEADFVRLKDEVEVVMEPKFMPWGNKAAQFRDPEGTLVSLYTPQTQDAKQRFAGR